MTQQLTMYDRIVPVSLGTRSYDIVINPGASSKAGSLLAGWLKLDSAKGLRVLMIADAAVYAEHGRAVEKSLQAAGAEVRSALVPSGEQSKSYAQTQALYDQLVDMTADRKTLVVAVGGGVTGDLAGFVAATYARGLRFVQVPTTLLSMVDSSVGGKTGINHPRGKNLIGAFHQPVGVIIDLETLNSLPDREYRSGLAEVVKYGVILDAEFFEYLEHNVAGLNSRDPEVLRHVVARSCELKADVVRQDEFETMGLRAILNYGHTFGHAFEAMAGYGTLLHGEAVSIGMICASRLAEFLGRITNDETRRQKKLLSELKLPVVVPADMRDRHDDILACMMLDKKTEGRELRFVLPSRIGHVEIVRGVLPEQAMRCL
ncbi:MAG TPA: 3-dehydroquinate synthase [Planctomycetaceae bacterium]|nr:3-dehydroquinate synthase [Planctomycetaceae bacterium]